MPRKAVDLDLLEMVLGRPPRRYPKGSPRNSLRARWIQRAAIATAALLRKNDRRGEAARKGWQGRREQARRYAAITQGAVTCGPEEMGARGRGGEQ